MKHALSIKYWLLIANAFLILIPLFGFQFLRLWDRHLVRVTEEGLIAESVLVAEVWAQELQRESGTPVGPRPAGLPDDVAPVLVGRYRVLPAAAEPRPAVIDRSGPEARAAQRVATLLHGVSSRGATEILFLDGTGCTLAAVYGQTDYCLVGREEVQAALAGRYAATARARSLPQSLSPSDIGRTGAVRISSALPVYRNGAMFGVVHATRAASGPLEVVLEHRGTVIAAVAVCVLLMLAVTWFLTWAISRPVRAVTSAAQAVVHGEPPRVIPPPSLAPSELAVLGATVNRMTELLTDRAEYIANFAAAVSHELKSPITSIRGAVELLHDAPAMEQEQRQRFLTHIDDAAARMERLVSRLLELARIQSAPEFAEDIDVTTFFRDFVRPYGTRVRLDVAAAPARIVINPDHLDAAVRNLVENALRHGGGSAVEITLSQADGKLAVVVRDHGPGISPGNEARIFDRFFTTERDSGGTGLGLAIVQAVAETRGGRVDFDTGPDGSTFRLVV